MAGLDDLIEAAGWAVGDPDPVAPPGPQLAAIADLPARGARWRLSPDGRWDRWSWLGNQWEPAVAPSPPPPGASPGTVEREWVQHPDGRWEDVALEWDPAVVATPDDEWLTGAQPLGEPNGEGDPVAGFWPAPPDHADDPTTSDGWWVPEIDDEADTAPGLAVNGAAPAEAGERVDTVVTPPAWFDADPDLLALEWVEDDAQPAEDTDASPVADPPDVAAIATDLSLDEWLAPPEMPGGNGAVVTDEVTGGPATPAALDDEPEPPPVAMAAPTPDDGADPESLASTPDESEARTATAAELVPGPDSLSSPPDAPEAISPAATGPVPEDHAAPDSHPAALEAISPTAAGRVPDDAADRDAPEHDSAMAGPVPDDDAEPQSHPAAPEARTATAAAPVRDDDAEGDAPDDDSATAGPVRDDDAVRGPSYEAGSPTTAGPVPEDHAEPDAPEDDSPTARPVPDDDAESGPSYEAGSPMARSYPSAPASARRSVTTATLDLLPDVAPLPAPTAASRRRGQEARPGVLPTIITPVVLTYAAYGAVWLLAAAVRAARDAWEVPWLFKGAKTVPSFDGQVAIALAVAGVLIGTAIVLLRRLAPDAPAGGPRLRV